MTRDETKKLLMIVMAFYPNWKPENKDFIVNAWQSVLAEKDEITMQRALKWYAESDKSGFAPSVGQLLDLYRRITEGEAMTAGEAWALVYKAISRSTYYAGEEFKRLPESVKKAVGSPGTLRVWASGEEAELGFAQAQFAKSFNAIQARNREYAVMSGDIRAILDKKRAEIAERNAALQIDEKPEAEEQTERADATDKIIRLREVLKGERNVAEANKDDKR